MRIDWGFIPFAVVLAALVFGLYWVLERCAP